MKHDALAPTASRYAAYGAVLFGWLLLLPHIAKIGGVDAFRDGAIVEWFQFIVVLAAAGLFAVAAYRLPQWRQLLSVLAMFALIAAVREQDALLDRTVPWMLGWKGPALACLIVGLIAAVRDLPRFGAQLEPFARTNGFAILWTGAFAVICAAQMIGHGDLLRIITADAYDADAKRVVEEAFESFGYLLLLAGTVETLVHLPHMAPSPIWRRGLNESPLAAHESPEVDEPRESLSKPRLRRRDTESTRA
ncbi:MAG: hypothetical protein WD294_12400 [Phycisphaeraceae bacterium]